MHLQNNLGGDGFDAVLEKRGQRALGKQGEKQFLKSSFDLPQQPTTLY